MKETEKIFLQWKSKDLLDQDLNTKLKSIEENPEEINDRFYKDLEFGTGGMRGVIGVGTNRINIHTVAKATQGLANYLNKKFNSPSVAIAYDSRIKSEIFAKEAASVLAANGIRVNIFKELMPTPTLSFAVRYLKCSAGIVITASHNPAKYNGYKVYGNDGCQITLDDANAIQQEINNLDIFNDIKRKDFNLLVKNNLIKFIDNKVIDEFLRAVSNLMIDKNLNNRNNLKIVYTPLNGSGLKCVTSVLRMNGFTDINIVPSQKDPDGTFPMCPYPNPEEKDALSEGLKICEKTDADILLATDPDCDRVGIAVKHDNKYNLLTGNEVGILLFDYICKTRQKYNTMPENSICIKTIVTTNMIFPIAKKYNVNIKEVLTGFKFIGEQIGFLEKKNEQNKYIFGFEESYGYLSGTHARDKDGVNAALLICEMTCYYKNQNLTLINILDNLYKEFGYYKNTLKSFTFEGANGLKKMQDIMSNFRNNTFSNIANMPVVSKIDYLNNSSTDLPKSNVIEFKLKNNSSIVIRPSGTEPKLKIYISTVSNNEQNSLQITQILSDYFDNLFTK